MFKYLEKAFHPEKSFFELTIVRSTFWTVSFISISSIISIFLNAPQSMTLAGNHEALNNSLSVFKFPIAVFALLIPLMAIFAANHRSEQTKRNILLLAEQNNFVNYHKHIELFSEYMKENAGLTPTIDYVDYRFLHRLAFPKTDNGTPTFEVSTDLIYDIKRDAEKFLQILTKLAHESFEVRARVIDEVESYYIKVISSYRLNNPSVKGRKHLFKDYETGELLLTSLSNLQQVRSHVAQLIRFFDTLFLFADNYSVNSFESELKILNELSIPQEYNRDTISTEPESLPKVTSINEALQRLRLEQF